MSDEERGRIAEDRTGLGRSIERGLREAIAHHAREEPHGPTSPTSPRQRRPRPPTTDKATGKEVRRADELAALLTARPAVLVTRTGEPIPPLKVGVRAELTALLKPGMEPVDLQRALFRYTRTLPYQLACVRLGAMRHGLDGRPVEPVSEEHRALARSSVAGLRQQGKARREAGQGSGKVAASDKPPAVAGDGRRAHPIEEMAEGERAGLVNALEALGADAKG